MQRRISYMLLVIVLFTSACTGSPAPIKPGTGGNATSPTSINLSSPSPASTPIPTLEYVDIETLPGMIQIISEPEVVGPGESLNLFSMPEWAGNLSIQGPEDFQADIVLNNQKAQFNLPNEAPAGIYTIYGEDEKGKVASGTFRAADQPGVWVALDRQYATSSERVKVKVTSYGFQPETTAVLRAFNVTSGLVSLVPDQTKSELRFAASGQFTQLGDYLGRTWELPVGISGKVSIMTHVDQSYENRIESNEPEVIVCDQPSYVKGNLGRPGWVRAAWVADGVKTTAANTVNGDFLLRAGPGDVVVRVSDDPITVQSGMLVRLDCGETEEISTADLSMEDSLFFAYPFIGMTVSDLGDFTATLSGDIKAEIAGRAECTVEDNILKITLDGGIDDPYLYFLEVPNFKDSGSYSGLFTLMGSKIDNQVGQVTVTTVVDKVESLMGMKASFDAEFAGEAGAGEFKGDLTCYYLPTWASNLNHGSNQTAGIFAGGRKTHAAILPPNYQGAPTEELCRKAVVTWRNNPESQTFGEYFAAKLSNSGLRFHVATLSDIKALLNLEQLRQSLGDEDNEDTVNKFSQQLDADFQFDTSVTQFGKEYIVSLSVIRTEDAAVVIRVSERFSILDKALIDSRLFEDVFSKMERADICTKVTPQNNSLNYNEKQDVAYEVTDLIGNPVSGAKINLTSSSLCGTLDPREGLSDDGEFKSTFHANQEPRACNEMVEFNARVQSPLGELRSRSDESKYEVSVSDQWDLLMDGTLGQGINLIKFNWIGNFRVDAGGIILGSGKGYVEGYMPDYPCLVMDIDKGEVRREPNPATVKGEFLMSIHGFIDGKSDEARLKLQPLGSQVPLFYTFGNTGCAPNLNYDLFTGPIIAMAAQQPTSYVLGVSPGYFDLPYDGGSLSYPTYGTSPGTLNVKVIRLPGGD